MPDPLALPPQSREDLKGLLVKAHSMGATNEQLHSVIDKYTQRLMSNGGAFDPKRTTPPSADVKPDFIGQLGSDIINPPQDSVLQGVGDVVGSQAKGAWNNFKGDLPYALAGPLGMGARFVTHYVPEMVKGAGNALKRGSQDISQGHYGDALAHGAGAVPVAGSAISQVYDTSSSGQPLRAIGQGLVHSTEIVAPVLAETRAAKAAGSAIDTGTRAIAKGVKNNPSWAPTTDEGLGMLSTPIKPPVGALAAGKYALRQGKNVVKGSISAAREISKAKNLKPPPAVDRSVTGMNPPEVNSGEYGKVPGVEQPIPAMDSSGTNPPQTNSGPYGKMPGEVPEALPPPRTSTSISPPPVMDTSGAYGKVRVNLPNSSPISASPAPAPPIDPVKAAIETAYQQAKKQYPQVPDAQLRQGAQEMVMSEIQRAQAKSAGMGSGLEEVKPGRSYAPVGNASGEPGGDIYNPGKAGTAQAELGGVSSPKGGDTHAPFRERLPVQDPETGSMIQPYVPVKSMPIQDAIKNVGDLKANPGPVHPQYAQSVVDNTAARLKTMATSGQIPKDKLAQMAGEGVHDSFAEGGIKPPPGGERIIFNRIGGKIRDAVILSNNGKDWLIKDIARTSPQGSGMGMRQIRNMLVNENVHIDPTALSEDMINMLRNLGGG